MNHYTSTIALPLDLPKEVILDFEGGELTSDSGLLLLAQADREIGLTRMMADAVPDKRQQSKVAHSLEEMLRSRVLAIVAGYPDANDLDTMRFDPAFKMACGQCPVGGEPLASQPTLSRYENSLRRRDLVSMAYALAHCVINCLPGDSTKVTIDFDATDDPCHGQQQLEGFNTFYRNHCYIPLMVQIIDQNGTQWPVVALLRSGNTNPLAGVTALLKRVVALLRERFPSIEITVRADGGFGSDKVIRCLDQLKVFYALGLPKNSRLTELGLGTVAKCVQLAARVGDGCKTYGSFQYKAEKWATYHRVVVKVESIRGEANSRYVVTNLWRMKAKNVYELYCGRGDHENRIKELKLDLSSGRTSCHRFYANNCRLLMHLAAYVIWTAFRARARGTHWATMQVGTLRLQVVKVAARVVESTRRVWVHLCSSYPYRDEWLKLQRRLTARAPAT